MLKAFYWKVGSVVLRGGSSDVCLYIWRHSHCLVGVAITRHWRIGRQHWEFTRVWCLGPFTAFVTDLTKPIGKGLTK